MRTILFFLLLFAIPILGFTQNKLPSSLAFRKLTTASGLSQDEVHSIVQDKLGFMWLTTINGLCRYDGKNVVKWAVKDTSTLKIMKKGLPTTHCIDDKDNFWIGTDHQGIFYYNKSLQKFQRFLFNADEIPSDFFIYKIISYKDTEIWAATSKGLWRYNIKTKQHSIDFKDKTIINIKPLNNHKNIDSYIICTQDIGSWLYNKNEWTYIEATKDYKNIYDVYIDTLQEPIKNKYALNTATQVPNIKYWIATQQGLYTIENKISRNLLHSKINQIVKDSKNIIWIAAENGLYAYNKTNTYIYQHNALQKESISSSHIIYMYFDNQKNLWLGTYTGGVNWFSLENQPITTLFGEQANIFKTENAYIFSNTSIKENKTGKVWQIKTDIPKKSFSQFTYLKDSKNNFWWSLGNNGLQFFNTNTHTGQIYNHDLKNNSNLVNNVITHIFEDPIKNVWISTFGGTQLYEPATNTFKHIRELVKNYDETANSTICYFIDRKGYIWLGKWEGGLDVIDPITKKYQHFSTENGLPNNCITDIHDDGEGFIWLATLNGIAKLNPQNIFSNKKTPIKLYSERDGLPTNRLTKIKYNAATSSSEECLYFKSDDGIAALYPSQLKENKYPPKASITSIKINGNLYSTDKPISDINEIALDHTQNNLTIEMAALSYIQPELNQYQYKLVNFDNTWIKNGTNNTAKYTNLAPNKYIFEFISYNNDGVASPTRTFTIHIKPAIWQRASFQIACFLLGFIILAYIIYFRIKTIEHRATLARQLSESELALLRAQMNPHFIFNCMNTIEAYIMTEQPDEASAYTRKFSKLTRAVLEHSEKALIPLETDLEILKIYIDLERIRYRNRFEVQFDVPDAVLDAEPNIPPMLLQPLVENAILHGLQHRIEAGGILKISVHIDKNKQLECIVEDNGIGRKASTIINSHRYTEKKSLATSITSKRLQLLEQQTKSSTNFMLLDLPQGTRAIIQLPLL